MEIPNSSYERELEILITKILLPQLLAQTKKHGEPFPWNHIPEHLLLDLKRTPGKVCRLLENY